LIYAHTTRATASLQWKIFEPPAADIEYKMASGLKFMVSDKINILLVEDERIIAEYNSLVLQKHGYSVLCAFTGEDAVHIALSNNYISLILMDINLGKGITGLQAVTPN